MHILKKNLKLVVKPPHLQKYARQIGNHETPGVFKQKVFEVSPPEPRKKTLLLSIILVG